MASRVLKKIKDAFPVHPTFLLLFLWFIFTKNIFSFITFCLVVLSHEFGHYFVAKKLGYKLDSFYIAPYGVSLNYKDSSFEENDEIFIALAGPVINFLLSFFVISFWWIFPSVYFFTQEFVFQSCMLGLFNLLPCYPLDGGRVFVGILSKNHSRKWAVKFAVMLNIIFAAILFVLFLISFFDVINPSLCFCSIFMIFGIIDFKTECKYQPVALFKKKTKNFSKPFFYCINSDLTLGQVLKKIEANRYTIFIVILSSGITKTIDEQRIKLLALKYPLDTPLFEIIS